MGFMLLSLPGCTKRSVVSEDRSPEHYLTQGLRFYQSGAFEEAATNWLEAARIYKQQAKLLAHSTALVQLSRAYQALGQYRKALQILSEALESAKQTGDRNRIAAVLGSLGNAYLLTGASVEASRYLQEGLQLARAEEDNGLAAVILNNLGNLLALQGESNEALSAYAESVTLARQTGNYATAVRALTNSAREAIQQGKYDEARAQLSMASELVPRLEPSHDKAYSLLSLGLAYNDLRPHLPEDHDRLLRQAAEAFNEATRVAQTIGDVRAGSYAWGYLGSLYEQQQRYEEALELTRRAVLAAQQRYAPESLYRWQWQTGRLLKALGLLDEAIEAYKRAVDTLQSFRQEITLGDGRGRLSVREALGPVYFGLVDLLLQRAALQPESAELVSYLIEARNVVESLKAVELQDYFQDDCVDALRTTTASLDVVSETAVVIYPIILPDRTELLVSLPAGLKRITVPVDADTITKEVRAFRRRLEKRTTRQYLPHAQKLYNWLIRPLEADLAASVVDTLVFVPDGPLRTIPMAALHDGKQFLISKYALAITPGLNLTDPRPLQRSNLLLLAAGLSAAVQNFPALPNVASEIENIQTLYDSEVLFDQTFLLSSTENALLKKPFSIVHIASHAQFRGNIEETFLLTFDDKLTLDRLEEMIGLFRFREEPLELLTLSACQTAAGDDRAALGLAGIAIKAGARSALATLWYINDQSSSDLVTEFYRQLQDPSISRATALQRAQLQLLNVPGYEHPGYWAPFLLINNWL
jgi:CHAT domain-containing protein/Tfp pilus assembly protein PilF